MSRPFAQQRVVIADAVLGAHIFVERGIWALAGMSRKRITINAIMPKTVARSPEVSELASELRRRGVDDVLDVTELTRALYSSDASLYRVVPQAVAQPRTVEEAAAVLDAARAVGMPVTTRGAGTSCAGNAVGPGLILDTSRHLTTIREIDPEARTARVEPGVVQSSLQAAAAAHGLRFGPDPSTHNRCTIGGMIGNNACGPRALGIRQDR